jgi:hypothetical protein
MTIRTGLVALLLAACVVPTGGSRAAECAADGKVKFVCGMLNPEDLVAVPGADWVVASGMNGGAIHLVNTRDYRTLQAFPSVTAKQRLDARTYASCPGPIDANEKEKFSAHGLNVRA